MSHVQSLINALVEIHVLKGCLKWAYKLGCQYLVFEVEDWRNNEAFLSLSGSESGNRSGLIKLNAMSFSIISLYKVTQSQGNFFMHLTGK